ncbi:MAG: UDP-2,3-diacylglucosamine diphosphatase [Dysgonomonas sp.]
MAESRTKVYFLSDAHLGSLSHRKKVSGIESTALPLPSRLKEKDEYFPEHEVERKLCRWLDMVKEDAKTIYLLGDIFDFWFEYKNVVPRGFVRFLGKIAEITDSGVEVHFFIGNHDIWITDYLQKECGMIVHRGPLVCDIYGKKFFLAHGDGLGDNSKSFKFIRTLFHSNICRKLFATIHPRWAVSFAHKWSNHSRETGDLADYLGEDKEHLVLFAKNHLKTAPNINYFLFGHRHILLDLKIAPECRVVILGDWINYFSYAVFDGNDLTVEVFEDSL